MTSNEIFQMERQNTSQIHLLLAGKFWQAWEMSAYQFSRHFMDYRVHVRFIKKIGMEMVYMGFSTEALSKVEALVAQRNCSLKRLDEKHLVIDGFTPYMGYAEWKDGVARSALAPEAQEQLFKPEAEKVPPPLTEKALLFAFKEFYELTKYLFARTVDTAKGYKYGLADKLRGHCLCGLEYLQCVQMGINSLDRRAFANVFYAIRIHLRLLLDFRQVSVKQWFFVSQKMDVIAKSLRLESLGPRVKGAGLSESGSPLEGPPSSKQAVWKIPLQAEEPFPDI